IFSKIEAAAERAGVGVLRLEADTPEKIESVFGSIRQHRAGALIVVPDPVFSQQRARIATLALGERIPSICGLRDYAEAGALITYGQDQAELWRRSATYVDRIVKGAKPADLPVQQPAAFELIVNN